MNTILQDKNIAILAADGFEPVEFEDPRNALQSASADVRVVSLEAGRITGMKHTEKAPPIDVDLTLEEAEVSMFDGVMIPGGLSNHNTLISAFNRRMIEEFADGRNLAA